FDPKESREWFAAEHVNPRIVLSQNIGAVRTKTNVGDVAAKRRRQFDFANDTVQVFPASQARISNHRRLPLFKVIVCCRGASLKTLGRQSAYSLDHFAQAFLFGSCSA